MNNPVNRFRPPSLAPPILALALMAFAAPAYRPTALAVNDEAAVRETLLRKAAATEKKDLAALTQIWANDEAVTVFENGHANLGWADYRDHHLAPELKEMSNLKYALSDIKVRVSGKTAWATMKYAISADLKERHLEGGGLATAVLEERNGRWQIVHWHSSSPRRPPAANPAKD